MKSKEISWLRILSVMLWKLSSERNVAIIHFLQSSPKYVQIYAPWTIRKFLQMYMHIGHNQSKSLMKPMHANEEHVHKFTQT